MGTDPVGGKGTIIAGGALDSPITWRSIIKIGLIWAAEYTMLALIEDAPAAVKGATLVCSLLALGALQFEEQLRSVNAKHLFRNIMVLLAVVYSGFVIYAVSHALHREAIKEHIKAIYHAATPLIEQKISISKANNAELDPEAIKQFKNDFEKWEKESAEWIANNLGDAARDQFLDISNISAYLSWGERYNSEYNQIMYRLSTDRRNLIAIMESKIYVD